MSYEKGQRVRVRPVNAENVRVGTPFVGTIKRIDYGMPGDTILYDVLPDNDVELDALTANTLDDDGTFVALPRELELLQ